MDKVLFCKYCKKPIVVEAKYGQAKVSHMACLYQAVKPVRDGLKKLGAKHGHDPVLQKLQK